MRGPLKTQAKAPAHPMPAPPVSLFQTRPFSAQSQWDESSSFEHDGSSLFDSYLERRTAGFEHDVGRVSAASTSPIIQMKPTKDEEEEDGVEFLGELGEQLSDMAGDAAKVVRRGFRKSAPAKRGPLDPADFRTDYVSDRIEAQNQRLSPTIRYKQQYEAQRGTFEKITDEASGIGKKIGKGVRHLLDMPAPPKPASIEELSFKSQSFNDALEGRQKGITAKDVRDERARREDEEHVRHLKYLNQGIEDTQGILREQEPALEENELTLRMERFRASLAGKSPEQLRRTGEELETNYASDPDLEELRHILREEKIIRHVIAQKPEEQNYDDYIADIKAQLYESNEADEARKPKKKKRIGWFKSKSKDEPQEVIEDEDNLGLQAMLAQAHKERIVQYLDPLINKVGAGGENVHKSKKFYLNFLRNKINQELEFIEDQFDASQLQEFKTHIESELEAREIETTVSQRGGISHLKKELEAKKQKNIEEMAEMFEPKESVFGKMRNVLRSDKEKQEMAKEREARVERERKEWQEIERIIKLYENRQ